MPAAVKTRKLTDDLSYLRHTPPKSSSLEPQDGRQSLKLSGRILANVPSLRVRLLISAAPANGALKAMQMYPMVATNLSRSLVLIWPTRTELE